MKKHTIGVMVLGFTGDYIPKFLDGVVKFAKGKKCNILACQVKLPEWDYGHFNYQYNSCLQFLQSETIDAVIVLSGFFISATTKDNFISYLKQFSNKPIVSMGVEVPFKNSYFITSKCEDSFRESFQHLIKVHGCKRIAFLAANSTPSDEAKERFEAYKKMLAENKMEYDPDNVIEGKFSMWEARDRVKDHVEYKGLTFDSIIAANDQMAFGAINALIEKGYKVPEDVKVIGYDGSDQCNKMTPSVSTINLNIEQQGYDAARIAFEKLEGKKPNKTFYFSLKNVYRQSCGCVSKNDDHTDYIAIDSKGKTEKTELVQVDTVKQFVDYSLDTAHVYDLLDLIQANTTTKDFFATFENTLEIIEINRFAVCLYENPITLEKGGLFKMPKRAELLMAIDREHQKQLINPGIFINPYEELIPSNIFNDDFSSYIIEPIYMGERHYGYAIYNMDLSKLNIATIYFRAISSGIANACEYTNKQNENEQLSEVSKTDELTKLLNRRGFMSTAEQALRYANSIDSRGLVFFCDMDGLKKINDGYGHDMGDEAIKGIADAIKKSFRKNDVIGRLSGDEFAVIAIGTSMKHFDMLYKKVLKNCDEIAKERGYPFNLSLSAGAVEFTEKDTDLAKLLSQADKNQYIEKRRKHAERVD